MVKIILIIMFFSYFLTKILKCKTIQPFSGLRIDAEIQSQEKQEYKYSVLNNKCEFWQTLLNLLAESVYLQSLNTYQKFQ